MLQERECENEKSCFSEELADQMFLEAQELLMDSPWITNIDHIDEHSSDIKDDADEIKVKS